MKSLLRRMLAPFVRWLVVGSTYDFYVMRCRDGVYWAAEDCFGNHYLREFTTFDDIAESYQKMRQMLADHFNEVPLLPVSNEPTND